MNKRFALIALLLAAVMLLSGCNLIGHDDELDGAQVVATVETNQGSTEITKAEWEAYRDYLASYYQQYYQQYFGVTMQLTDDDVKAYGDAAVEQMIESVVLQDKMKELGFEPLPEEDAADVESYADSMFSFYKLMIRLRTIRIWKPSRKRKRALLRQPPTRPPELRRRKSSARRP